MSRNTAVVGYLVSRRLDVTRKYPVCPTVLPGYKVKWLAKVPSELQPRMWSNMGRFTTREPLGQAKSSSVHSPVRLPCRSSTSMLSASCQANPS